MVQRKSHYKYHKYERHDRDISHHDGFKGITGITSSHAKQDYKVQWIKKWFIWYGHKLGEEFCTH